MIPGEPSFNSVLICSIIREKNGSKKTEQRDYLVLDILDQSWQNRNLLNRFRNLLPGLVVPVNNWISVLCNLLHPTIEGRWPSRRNMRVGHLCSCGIGLQLVCFPYLVLAAKYAR